MHTQTQKLTREQRQELAHKIIDAMREHYEEQGEEGDFDDGYRHLRDDASDDELRSEEERWCKQM
jgi:hypothetical protein